MSSEDEGPVTSSNPENWPRFLVMCTPDGGSLKLNPFAVSKDIEGLAEDVKEIK